MGGFFNEREYSGADRLVSLVPLMISGALNTHEEEEDGVSNLIKQQMTTLIIERPLVG